MLFFPWIVSAVSSRVQKIVVWPLRYYGSSSEYSNMCLSCADIQAQFNNLKDTTNLLLILKEKGVKKLEKIALSSKTCLSVWKSLCDRSLLLLFLNVYTAQVVIFHLVLLELVHISYLKLLFQSKQNLWYLEAIRICSGPKNEAKKAVSLASHMRLTLFSIAQSESIYHFPRILFKFLFNTVVCKSEK